ncbi:hypothetical protein PUN28_019929 [Cardiocondyla obscurior]|uniref:Uncharacterized protein n=1 Tax=Cardiocondyla obscurior TaxID=286306 RepID=A0AAW2EDI0_9HYME
MYIDILTRRDKYEIMLRASNITRLYIINNYHGIVRAIPAGDRVCSRGSRRAVDARVTRAAQLINRTRGDRGANRRGARRTSGAE